jgi:hypothetical protein
MIGSQFGTSWETEEASSGDNWYYKRPLFHEEPLGNLRVQTLSHTAFQRGQLSSTYTGQETSDQLAEETGTNIH